MLLVAAVIGLFAAAAVAIRWTASRVDCLGRRRPFPLVGTMVPLVIAGAAAVPVVRHARLEARLGAVASALAGHRVSVRCETLSQAWVDAHAELGYVRFDPDGRPEPRATLGAQACSDLTAWVRSRPVHPSLRQVIALHVLTHEAMHLAGERDEARAECAAVQRDARTARLLGATPAEARTLAVTYWRVAYPDLSDDYRSGECGPGGSLDDALDDAPWAPVKG